MSDFKDDDFDNFDDGNFDDFSSGSSLKDAWQSNPALKIFLVIAVVIAIIAAVVIFTGEDEEKISRVGRGVDKSETLGGEVSPNYQKALEDVNRQRLEEAQRTGGSTIPMLINPEETELLTQTEELPPYQEFDPLSTFRASIKGEPREEDQSIPQMEQEPTLVAPEQVYEAQPQVPAPSPEAVQNLASAMSSNVSQILGNHSLRPADIMRVTSEDYLKQQEEAQNGGSSGGQMYDTNGDGIPDTPMNAGSGVQSGSVGFNSDTGDVVVQTVLVPAGTINYAQTLIEANSDVPGPVLVQLVSGPLSGARMIGRFNVVNDLLVLNFNSVVVDGLTQSVNAIALDPNSTLPGVASEVNQRYFSRVVLPAAARFLEGVGSAIAQDSETTVTVSGDTVIQEQPALDFEQELGRGAEEAFSEVADFMDDEASQIQPLVRLARGTPIGIFFLDPVFEENNQ